jgi:hypothetical protein
MANGSPFAVNFLYLAFLLVPGYISLRGYLGATVQLDTLSRFDKLLLSAVGGTLTLGVSLVGYRAGFVEWAWRRRWERPTLGVCRLVYVCLRDRCWRRRTLLARLFARLLLWYCCHVWNGRKRSQQDLEQPWETVVKQSVPMSKVVVVTREGERIRGQLYRIGSPSEDYDLLLSGAEREAGDERIPIGMSYHHYRDVARVQFPEMQPGPIGEEANALVRFCMGVWSWVCWVFSGGKNCMNYICDAVDGCVDRIQSLCCEPDNTDETTDDDQ